MGEYKKFNPTFDPEVEAMMNYMKEHGDIPLPDGKGGTFLPSEFIYKRIHKTVEEIENNK